MIMLETESVPPGKMDLQSSFISAIRTSQGKKPQAIAHRGYKAAHAENTMGAFSGAVEVGAHAIETDVHLSRDGVVVLSHDPTLKRCFGLDQKISDSDWAYLKTVKTLRTPAESMPRLRDLLEYLTSPGLEDIWILLDLKRNNDAEYLFERVADAILSVKPSRPWHERILLGCWAARYMRICKRYLPTYSTVYIGWNISFAQQFLKVPGVNFNMLKQIIVGPCGSAFLKYVRKARRSLLLWTVNDEGWMKRCIRSGVDGVVTDDPKKFLEVCKNYRGESVCLPWRHWGGVIILNMLAIIFVLPCTFKYSFHRDFTVPVMVMPSSGYASTAVENSNE